MGRIFLTFRVSQERLNARVILEGFEKAVSGRAIFGEIGHDTANSDRDGLLGLCRGNPCRSSRQ